MEFSRVGVGWRLVLDVGQQNPRRAGRTDFWSEPPSKNKHFPLVHCWLLFKNLCFLIHLHTLWSEQYTMTCRHPSGKIMHELFLFIPLVHCLLWEHNAAFKLLKRPCYKKTPLWSFHMNRAHKSVRSDEYMCINYLCFPQFKTKEYKGMWCGD